MTAWIGWARQLADLGSESRLRSRSYCPVGSALRPWRKLPSQPLLPPPFTQAPERFSLERPVLLNVLVFGWKDRNLMENRIFDNFVQLWGNYLENIDLDTVEQGAEERVGQSKS